MQNIIEYVENNMNGFTAQPFGAVDSLVLAKLSYVRFDGIVPRLAERRPSVRLGELLRAERFEFMFQYIRDVENNRRFLFALAASPRYRNTTINFYVDHYDTASEKQFSAVTFFLEDNTAYCAFRGTDSTFVGWKEDFNMAYLSPIPSQEEAVRYLNAAAKRLPWGKRMRSGGHSKGGNLAVYAAVKCEASVQKRVVAVYNHDGPGFKEDIFTSPEYLRLKCRIQTTLPESSLVGMLLQHHEDYRVIKSSRRGIMQHEPFSWCVENGDFCYSEELNNGALIINKSLSEWLNTLDDEKRKLFSETLFGILEATEAGSFAELSDDWQKGAVAMLAAVKTIDPEVKKFVFQTINELVKLSFKNLFRFRQNAPAERP